MERIQQKWLPVLRFECATTRMRIQQKWLPVLRFECATTKKRNERDTMTIKKTLAGLAVGALALTAAPLANAQDAITLQLKWVTQAQFAGYLVAEAKGYYDEAGLDVAILPGGPNIAPEQVIAGGGADIIVDWMGGALAAREKGVALVNIAQPFKRSGLMMICPEETGITSAADFPGHTLGVWFFGNEYPFFAWMNKLGLSTEGGSDGVTVLQQSFDIQPMIQGQADCISVMTYNEYGQALDAGYGPDNLTIFNYTEMDNDLLEDGLYVMEDTLSDPARVDAYVRFIDASMKGWQYALDNPDEAAQIVVDMDEAGAAEYDHQLYMVGEVSKLVDATDPALDLTTYERTKNALLDQGIIENEPDGAYTTEITDAVAGMM
jgi:NitT/TauT family transport system substrate-binding protein